MVIIDLNTRRFLLSITLIFIMFFYLEGQDYQLLYENNFEDGQGLKDFEFSDSSAWKLSDTLKNRSLELFDFSKYKLPVSSPFNIAVLKTVKIGSFVLEVDVKQTGIEYPHRDLCLFFGMKDPTNYYYVHISSTADDYSHSVFIVNDEPLSNITSKVSSGVNWDNVWHKVRIERNATYGIIKVFFDNMNAPIMEGYDIHFSSGYIGFGSFDDTGMFDNIKIWGIEEKKPFTFFN